MLMRVCLLLSLVTGLSLASMIWQPKKYGTVSRGGDQLTDMWPDPPAWKKKAEMARYLAHYGTWTVVSSMSVAYKVPLGMVLSYVDGPLDNSTGIPYFYIAKLMDFTKNIEEDNSVSMVVTLAESMHCTQEGWDPMSPLCARVILTGKIVPVKDKAEHAFAQKSLFMRHPVMKTWPSSHGWMVYKIDIEHVDLLDFFGGMTHLTLKEYFQAHP